MPMVRPLETAHGPGNEGGGSLAGNGQGGARSETTAGADQGEIALLRAQLRARDDRIVQMEAERREERARIAQLETNVTALIGAIARQGQVHEAMLAVRAPSEVAQATPPTPPPPAPVFVGLTFGDVWTWYLGTLGKVSWRGVAVSVMQWALAWFAPSLCRRRYIEDADVAPVCVLRDPRDPTKTVAAGPDMLLKGMRVYHWTEFRVWLATVAPEVGAASRNHILSRAKAMLNKAAADEKIDTNPFDKVKRETTKKKRKTKFTDNFLEAFRPFACAWAWAYEVTICDSGQRPGEARMLRWDQVDNAIPHITDDTEVYEIEISAKVVKGKMKPRPAFLTRRCLDAYAELPRLPGNPFVFGSPNDPRRPYSKRHLWHLVRVAANAAGLEAVDGDGSLHPHDGRRAYASKLIASGADLSEVKNLLGHEEIATTMLYVDNDKDDLRKAHSRLATAARLPPRRIPTPPGGENPK